MEHADQGMRTMRRPATGAAMRELMSTVTVVLGLIFVGLEMRQNTLAIRGQTRNAMAENAMEYLGWQATSGGSLPEVEAKLRSSGLDQLTEAEWIQFAAFIGAQMREWENSHYQNKVGLFTEAEYEARKGVWRERLTANASRAGYERMWLGARERFAPDFREEIDAIIQEEELPQNSASLQQQPRGPQARDVIFPVSFQH